MSQASWTGGGRIVTGADTKSPWHERVAIVGVMILLDFVAAFVAILLFLALC